MIIISVLGFTSLCEKRLGNAMKMVPSHIILDLILILYNDALEFASCNVENNFKSEFKVTYNTNYRTQMKYCLLLGKGKEIPCSRLLWPVGL
jgi:hypothetical protein